MALICLSIVSCEPPKVQIDIDYQAATDAFTKAKEIREKYMKFKEKVAKKFQTKKIKYFS